MKRRVEKKRVLLISTLLWKDGTTVKIQEKQDDHSVLHTTDVLTVTISHNCLGYSWRRSC